MLISNNYRLSQCYNQSFSAKKISEHTIDRIYTDGYREPLEVDFIEFDRNNIHDIELFEDIYSNMCADTNDDDNLIPDIVYDFLNPNNASDSKSHFYAISKKQKNYNKVNKDNLLGLAQAYCSEYGNPVWLDDIQSFDSAKFNSENRKYSGVGTSMLNGLVGKLQRDIEGEALDESIPFYLRYGFVRVENSIIPNHMRYYYNKTKTHES